MLNDRMLSRAISQILIRSEKQQNPELLIQTYVETGVLPQLDNENNQVLFGRRGTGKTHLFRVLEQEYRSNQDYLSLYMDLRILGSAQQLNDPDRPLTQRYINLFKDFLGEIQYGLMDVATNPEMSTRDDAINKVERLGEAIINVAHITKERQISRELSKSSEKDTKGTLGIKNTRINVGLNGSYNDKLSSRYAEIYQELFENNIIFSEIYHLINDAIEAVGKKKLLIFIDEWTGIANDVQPYFAEFLKRSFFPMPNVTIKIASLEYRSKFNLPLSNNNLIGFELGGDISANLDLDDYYVYDRNPDKVMDIFQELGFKHIKTGLPEGYMENNLNIHSSRGLRQRLFTERATFIELVRAAEGVARDFINIFNTAFFDAQRRGRDKIDVRAVREAARQWYEKDKAGNLSQEQHDVLRRIVEYVIVNKKGRSFMLERSHANHQMIQSLFDFRIIHLISRGYSDRKNPGIRYNIYTLDYGTYVDLLQTKKKPLFYIDETRDEDDEPIVPFDDKRSIRRIILDPRVLELIELMEKSMLWK
jgi:Cdc6-like AAA superfamily ATPase